MSIPESPLQRLRRLEAEERAEKARLAGTPAAPAPGRTRRSGIAAALAAVLIFLATKGKLLLGALKLGPLLTTLGTMGLSAWIYAQYYGAYLAVGLVLLVLLHEIGHGLAAKAMRLKVGAPVFIPFFGAVIALKEQPRSTWTEAVVGLGGPAAGLCGSAAVLALGLALPAGYWRELCLVLAWFNSMINFFNLLPVFGLDGDRISQPFVPWYWIPGSLFILALGLASWDLTGVFHPFILFIFILGLVKGGRGWRRARRKALGAAQPARLVDRLTPARSARYTEEALVTPGQRRAAAWAYFAVAGLLTAVMLASHALRPLLQASAG
jgi:Zn-dependent protease